MYTRYEVVEHDATYHVSYTWIVDVPQASPQNPDTFRMLRKKGSTAETVHAYAHMDSPSVKKGSQRKAVAQAVLTLMSGGPDSVKNGQGWLKTKPLGAVSRKLSERKKRAVRPLYPVGAEAKGDKFVMNFILDDDKAPVRYQVETPLNAFEDTDQWVYKVYRRTNPRGKGAPNYDMLVMSQGRKRVINLYEEKHLYHINNSLAELAELTQPEDTTTFRLLEQLRKRYNNAAADYNPDNPTGNETIQMRLKTFGLAIGGKLFEAMRNPTGDNRSQWQMIIEVMNTNRDKLSSKFEAHMEAVKAKAILQKQSAKVSQAAQTTASSFIPPMPTLSWGSGQTAPKALETPANGTSQGIGALTAFLGGTDHAPQSTQPEPGRQSDIDLEREVREFLAAIPKD